MASQILLKTKNAHHSGFVEMVVWQLSDPVEPSVHFFKYRLVYIVNGKRVLGYDNERGKGDHRHLRELELAYVFVDIETLIADFFADVEKIT